MDEAEKLKVKNSVTREDIANLLASIGKPGEKRAEKIAAVAQLGHANSQGIKVEDALNSYEAF